MAASRVLNADGSLNQEFASRDFIEVRAWHREVGCQPAFHVTTPGPPESRGYFAASLLLSDVAVTATLNEVVPGFSPYGHPMLLFSLSEVVPLREHTPLPKYALVPVKRMVVDDHLFCEIDDVEGWPTRIPLPQVGDELVVIGRWTSDAVVRVGVYRHTGALGLVGENGESLKWHFSAWRSGPETVSDMRRHIDDAAASGLLDATRSIARDDHYSVARRKLADRVVELRDRGCQIDAVEQNEGGLTFHHDCDTDK